MGYLFLMTAAGSALFVGYLCWEKILGKSMTQGLKYRALMIVMLVYAMPLGWLRGVYRNIVEVFWPDEVATEAKGVVSIAEIEIKEAAYWTKDYKLLTLGMSIWFTIAVVILIIRMARYFNKSQTLHALAIECEDKNLEQTLKDLRETLGCRCKPEVAWTRVDNETFTLGTIRPIIYLQKKYAEGDLYWILKHEMTHIVRKDLLVKLVLEFVCCLHWFNPLIYLLEREMRYLCESSCDEKVIKGHTEKECQIYMDLLARNKVRNRLKVSFGSALESSNKEIDKRIALMKDRRCIKGREKAIVIAAFIILIVLDSLIALAYPDVHYVKGEVPNVAEDSVDGENFWIYDYAEDGYGTYEDTILYDEQFIDGEGHIYPIDYADEHESYDGHDVVTGFVQIHVRNSDGGCALETYDGTRCKECGIVWKGDFLYSASKIPCPH